MSLIIQIQSLAISFLFGIVFSLFYNLLYFILYTKYTVINIIVDIFFSLTMFGFYFLLLYNVNNGIIHVYFLIIFFTSFAIYNKLFVKFRVKWKKTNSNQLK
jgi:hypothetical protein